MKPTVNRSLLLPALLLAMPLANAAPSAEFKQLAGPPTEFELMSPADPATAALHSQTAMIPVELSQTRTGQWRWQGTLPIEESDFTLLLFSAAADDWQLSMQSPQRAAAEPIEQLSSEHGEELFGMAGSQYPTDFYRFTQAPAGQWTLTITAASGDQKQGFVLINSGGENRLESYPLSNDQRVGGTLSFVAQMYSQGDAGEYLNRADNLLADASLRITAPSGAVWTEAMFDDGLHQDGKAGDGIFGGDFLAAEAGNYVVQVVASGTTADGMAMIRTAEHLVPVIDDQLTLAGASAYSQVLDARRLQINLPVDGAKEGAHYRVYGQVWGSSVSGGKDKIPVAWLGGMSKVNQGQLELGFDSRWVALAGARAPFELRQLRIEDPDHFITVSNSERLALEVTALPAAAGRAVQQIDADMLMGPKPIAADTRAGPKLLMVHGYCSGDAWGPVMGQFSNAAKFTDFNQNRSHDLFARLIRDFGSSYDSFGIVAHSQGGAASLHLYTFYWSGLDFATGNRLIQSVGTPYQGTPLAGNIALLGDIFGIGCGANTDLTTSGAASWLSGIPSWARAEINYYTTSFTDVWWRPDWCQFASDLLLSDPDDGVIERSRGQLSGAVNRGHKTGWCHTSGMRDPSQLTDSSRNSTMNSNAAR